MKPKASDFLGGAMIVPIPRPAAVLAPRARLSHTWGLIVLAPCLPPEMARSFGGIVTQTVLSAAPDNSRPKEARESDPADDPKVPQTGEKIGRRYELRRRLGSGATGVVFEAVHTVIGKRVALKWLYRQLAKNRTTAQRFLNEARAACRIDHPNVIDVFDAGRDGDSLFLVMEVLRGEPLSSRIHRGFEQPHDLVELVLPALEGVGAAHQVGIVHRDLKPENIFLCGPTRGRPSQVKVLDFGVSKLRKAGSSSSGEQLTRAGAYVGSPFYTAPEQITNCNEVDGRADVYSFGVILYEALTGGQLPHEADTLADLFQKIRHGKPRWIGEYRNDLPEALELVVHRAIEADPAARYPTVEALAGALMPFSKAAPIPTVRSAHSSPGTELPEGDDAPTIQDAGVGEWIDPGVRDTRQIPSRDELFTSRPPPAGARWATEPPRYPRSRLSRTYQDMSLTQYLPWYMKALLGAIALIAVLLGAVIGLLLASR